MTGRRVGYLQAQPRIWTRSNQKQIQLVVRAGLSATWDLRILCPAPSPLHVNVNYNASLREHLINLSVGSGDNH